MKLYYPEEGGRRLPDFDTVPAGEAAFAEVTADAKLSAVLDIWNRSGGGRLPRPSDTNLKLRSLEHSKRRQVAAVKRSSRPGRSTPQARSGTTQKQVGFWGVLGATFLKSVLPLRV